MGLTNSKKIQQTLEDNYKPIRKYYSNFYGQITILQERSTNILYAKSQKIINPTKDFIQLIQKRLKNNNQFFVNIKQVYRVPVDLCSEIQKYTFLMEYSGTTVQDQIVRRMGNGKPFKYLELVQIWLKMLHGLKQLGKINIVSKSLVSNDFFLYFGNSKIKVLEQIFCDKNQNEIDKFEVRSNQNSQLKGFYISPQSFTYSCRQQKQKSKQIALNQKSRIFTLGMNFIQCALLSDLSQLYNYQKSQFQFQILHQFQQNLAEHYGENIYNLIYQMTKPFPEDRPTFQLIEQSLKYLTQVSFQNSNASATSGNSITRYD